MILQILLQYAVKLLLMMVYVMNKIIMKNVALMVETVVIISQDGIIDARTMVQ